MNEKENNEDKRKEKRRKKRKHPFSFLCVFMLYANKNTRVGL
jgi:uncharacterized membrane protein YkvA (DUF1232 family)